MVKKNCCIFISGKGSNLRQLLLSSRKYNFPINIKLIITSNLKAKGNIYSKKYNIPLKVLTKKDLLSINKILYYLKSKKISLICLAGYMHILPKYFLQRFNGKILNIHPSLLPKYKGLNTFFRVLKNKEKRTGCTIHYVNEKLDSGKIVLQKFIYIDKGINEEKLKKNVQQIEHRFYSKAIIKIYKN